MEKDLQKRRRKKGVEESLETLKKRAEELAQESEVDSRIISPTQQALLFNLGKQVFAIYANSVKEILNPFSLKWVPFTPHLIAGVVNLRGDIVTVFDLASLIQKDISDSDSESEIIFLKNEDITCGVLVDRALEIIEVNEEEILEPIFSDNKIIHFLSATIKKGNNLYQVISLKKILQCEDVKALWDSAKEEVATFELN